MNREIIGHGRIRDFLRALAAAEPSPHRTFLFFGPDSVGKSLVAREFAARLLGTGPSVPDTFPDFRSIAPESDGDGGERDIPIGKVREATVFLSRFPIAAARRVLLIEDADRMTDEAQNALLKGLEEPNDTSVLILVSSRPGAVRDTLRSRAFPVTFSLVPETDIRIAIGGESVREDTPSPEPFFYSLGRPGIVVAALSDPEGFSVRRDILRKLFRIRDLTPSERIALSERLSSSASETLRMFGWWVSGLRAARRDETDPQKLRETYRRIEAIEEAAETLRNTNANTRLVLDRLFLASV